MILHSLQSMEVSVGLFVIKSTYDHPLHHSRLRCHELCGPWNRVKLRTPVWIWHPPVSQPLGLLTKLEDGALPMRSKYVNQQQSPMQCPVRCVSVLVAWVRSTLHIEKRWCVSDKRGKMRHGPCTCTSRWWWCSNVVTGPVVNFESHSYFIQPPQWWMGAVYDCLRKGTLREQVVPRDAQ